MGAEKVSMYKPWARTDTQDWIHSLESRIEDIDYYLKRTTEWCERNGIWENSRILMCCLITCIWVSSMRNEHISFQEIVEFMGINDLVESGVDKVYDVCEEFRHLDHEDILELLITKTGGWDSYLPS